MKNICIQHLAESTYCNTSAIAYLPADFVVGSLRFHQETVSKLRSASATPGVFDAYLMVYAAENSWFPYGTTYNGACGFIQLSEMFKSHQLTIIQRTARAMELQKFHYAEFFNGLAMREFENTKYVLKADLNAACGYGQAVIDVTKIPLGKLDEAIREKDLDALKELGVTLTVAPEDKGEAAALQQDCIDRLQQEGLLLMEYIPDIVDEYRIITNAEGAPFVSVRRERYDSFNGFYQATAKTGDPYRILDEIEFADHIPCGSEVFQLLSAMNTPLTGYDVYIRKNGTFGIFEFANSFGVVNVPHLEIAAEGKKFFAKHARQLLQRLDF